MLEFSVALKLRELMIPVSVVTAVLHVLEATEKAISRDVPGFRLPDSLTEKGAPELRVIITDGQRLFFALHTTGKTPKLLGGINLTTGGRVDTNTRRSRKKLRGAETDVPAAIFTPAAGRERGRVEVSVTGLAKDLSRALGEA